MCSGQGFNTSSLPVGDVGTPCLGEHQLLALDWRLGQHVAVRMNSPPGVGPCPGADGPAGLREEAVSAVGGWEGPGPRGRM